MNRKDIIAKIHALRAKTVAAGCSEAEALSALAAIARLMDRYDIQNADLADIEQEVYGGSFREYGMGSKRITFHPTKYFWRHIARMLGCRSYQDGRKYVIFGEREAVQTAFYMIDLLRATADMEWTRFNKARTDRGEISGATVRSSWMAGYCVRISERIKEVIAEREAAGRRMQAESNQCAAVMVLRNKQGLAKWEQWKASKGLKLRHTRKSFTIGSASAMAAGSRTGSSVNLTGGGSGVGAGARRLT